MTTTDKHSMQAANIAAYWERTSATRNRVRALLAEGGFEGLKLSTFFFDENEIAHPRVSTESAQRLIERLAGRMLDPLSAEYCGFYLLNIWKALDNEAALSEELTRHAAGAPFRQMAAFKANHSLPLQYARLLRDPESGLEVASAAEVVAACSLGFNPDRIIFANPTMNPRELLVSYQLGVTTFSFDHIDKLRLILRTCEQYRLDKRRLRLLLRLSTDFADPRVNMNRFGVDASKNKAMVRRMLQLLDVCGVKLAGAAFHVGIAAKNYVVYEQAFENVIQLFSLCREEVGYVPDIINIGGGVDSNDAGHRFLGTLSLAEQLACVSRELRRVRDYFGRTFEIWSEFGQGYVGNAGSLFVRIDFHEMRANPNDTLRLFPMVLPGTMLWSHAHRQIRATHEQRLVVNAGQWTLGVLKHVTLYPEVWKIGRDGHLHQITFDDSRLVPTSMWGKSCDASDTLNPTLGEDPIHLLLPRLDEHEAEVFLLRLCTAAYADNGGDFNWQTTKFFPTHYVLDDSQNPAQSYPRRVLRSPHRQSAPSFEYRDRSLARNHLTSLQIHSACQLVAEQLLERDPMIAWLRKRDLVRSPDEQEALHQFVFEQVSASLESRLGMVRLRVPVDAPDREGQVVAVVMVKVLRAQDKPTLPSPWARDKERHRLFVRFDVEARMLQQVYKISTQLDSQLFPMAYVSMSATLPGRESDVRDLYTRILDLAQGVGDVETVGTLVTEAQTNRAFEGFARNVVLLDAPYTNINVGGDRPFAEISFGEQNGTIRFLLHDLRGPLCGVDRVPQGQTIELHINDSAHRLWSFEDNASILDR